MRILTESAALPQWWYPYVGLVTVLVAWLAWQLPGRDGQLVFAGAAILAAAAVGTPWTSGNWWAIVVPAALIVAGAAVGLRWPVPAVGFGLLAVAAAICLLGPDHSDVSAFVYAIALPAGVGYVVSATFLVAIVDQLPGLEGKGSWAFMMVGLAATPACIIWDRIARRVGNFNALLWTFLLQILGIMLPVLATGLVPTILGAMLFGGTFIGSVSLVLTIAGRYYPTKPAKMMGKMTVSYGVAQILAPAITGVLAEQSGSYADGLYLAAGVMVLGSLLMYRLKVLADRDRATEISNATS